VKGLKKPFLCCCAVTLFSGAAVGAEFALVPKSASGGYSISGNEITLDGGGQRVFIELELSGWTPYYLNNWQAVIDATGYSSGSKGTLVPFTGSIDQFRADYVFAGYTNFPAVDISTPNYRYAATVFGSPGPLDPGVAKYGGSLEVDVPVGAVGTFTVGYVTGPANTLMVDPYGVNIAPLTLTPVVIVVPCQADGDCDDGEYCNGVETCSGGLCYDGPGDPCPGPDGDANCAESCDETADNCTAADPSGSLCGDQGDTDCDNPNTCNATGACQENYEPPGTPCGDSTDTQCDHADTCDGSGTCDDNLEPNGTGCTDDQYCNGTETCTDGFCGGSTGDPCPGPDGDGDCAESCDEPTDTCTADDPNGSACDDGTYCNGTETCGGGVCGGSTGDPCPGPDGDGDCSESCDEAGDNCAADDPNGSACDDGAYCNGTETCGGGVCGNSTGDPCPGPDGDGDCGESCDEGANNCTADDPNGSACDDGEYCTGTETCSNGVCRNSTGDPCPGADGDADCAESCDETSDNCTANDPTGAECDLDGLFCTGDTCDGAGTCDPGTDPCPGPDGDGDCSESCDESVDDCTGDDPNGSVCDDGLYCSGSETCSGGVCGNHTGDPCPGPDGDADCAESCNEAAGDCTGDDPNGSTCDDGLYCTGTETCSGGTCSDHTGDPCPGPDGDADCAESCNETAGDCTASDPVGSLCDLDGLFCTGDTCTAAGACEPGGNPCPGPDGDEDCSETCDEGTHDCTGNDPNGSSCDDGLYCTGTDACSNGVCLSTGDPCPGPDGDGDCTESCNETADNCTANDPNGSTCDDGLYCNVNEVCQAGSCGNGDARNCSDGVDCTDDWCDDSADACMNDPDDANCNNGQWCDGVEICDEVLDCLTQAGSIPNCNDSIGCTDDWCDEINDVCQNDPDNAYCNNGQWCDGVEICDEALDCITQAGSIPDPNDGIGCTDDSCDEVNDVIVNTPNDANCPDDGLFCNGDEYCHPTNDCDHTGSPCIGPCDEVGDSCSCEAPLVQAVGSRYLRIAIQPPDAGPQAILITPQCPGGVGRYAGPPEPFDMDGDGVADENIARFADAVSALEGFRTPQQWGELYGYGLDLVPGTTYVVQGDCGSPGNPGLSAPTVVTTCNFGDTTGDFVGGEWLPCDGNVMVTDAVAVVDCFLHRDSAPPVYMADQAGLAGEGLSCVPDQVGGIVFDAIMVMDAFKGMSYTASTGCSEPVPEICDNGVDDDCDDLVDCDDGSCARDFACSCRELDEPCVEDVECCSGWCQGPPGRKECK